MATKEITNQEIEQRISELKMQRFEYQEKLNEKSIDSVMEGLYEDSVNHIDEMIAMYESQLRVRVKPPVREEKIQIRVTSEKKEKLNEIAETMGVSLSALCSVILGQYIHQYERVSLPIATNAVEIMTKKFEGMTKEDIARMMAPFIPTERADGHQERRD